MNLLLTIVVILCSLALIFALIRKRSRLAEDGVLQFRQQLGALSRDASRPVIRPRLENVRPEESDDGT